MSVTKFRRELNAFAGYEAENAPPMLVIKGFMDENEVQDFILKLVGLGMVSLNSKAPASGLGDGAEVIELSGIVPEGKA